MKWFDGYVQSMETFAAGKIDGNSQTLNCLKKEFVWGLKFGFQSPYKYRRKCELSVYVY
jgi:hypothetical protein